MKEVKRMQISEFIQWLRTQKNPEKIEGMEKYMRSQFKFLGLQAFVTYYQDELSSLSIREATKNLK